MTPNTDLVYKPTSLFSLPRSGNPDCIQLIAFSPSGAFLAATFGKTIRVWNTNDSAHFIFDYKAWKTMEITCILWNNEGLHCGYSDGGFCTIDFDERTWVSHLPHCAVSAHTFRRGFLYQAFGWAHLLSNSWPRKPEEKNCSQWHLWIQ